MGKKIRFILTCMCILLPLLFLCLYTRFNLIAFADEEGPYYIWNKETTNMTHEKRYDIIILGDSTANASYLPTVLSDSCLNLALGGGTPMENYYTLKEWLDHNASPKVCYISFADGHLTDEETEFWTFWHRCVFFHRYGLEEELQMLIDAIHYQEGNTITSGQFLDLLEFEFGFPNRYMTAIVNAKFDGRKTFNLDAKQNVETQGGVYLAKTGEFTAEYERSYDSFSPAPLLDIYYHKLIALCLDNDIQVRILKLPLPENTSFSEEYETEFNNYYNDVKKTFPKVTVDWIGNYPQNDFYDSAHMNYHGALQFSTEIKELYPEDFGEDVYSDERINAINFYLGQINRMDDLLMWISGKDYTAIVCDGTGKFEAYSQGLAQDEPTYYSFESKNIIPKDKGDFTGRIFAVTGKGSLPEVPVFVNGEALELDLNGGPVQLVVQDGILNVIVLDQYSGQSMSNKTFRWEDEQFVLL